MTLFKPGEAVFGTCKGAFAEYACAPEANVFQPESVDFDQAAAVPIQGLLPCRGCATKDTFSRDRRS